MAQAIVEMNKTLAPEDYEKLLHHSYYIVSEASVKGAFFKGQNLRASSTLIFLDLLKYWGHPCTMLTVGGAKKARAANNLLLLEADSSWKNQNVVKHDGKVWKSFEDWGSFATHVSDLLVFRQNFFNSYSYEKFLVCYDIEEHIRSLEYWSIIQKTQ